MANLIKKRGWVLLIVVLPLFTFSQKLSPKSKQVKAAWEALNKHPDSKQLQLAYLKIFPSNKPDFIAVFDPDDFNQLYDESNKYIDSFIELVKYYPVQVIDKVINIGKDMKWKADATGYLQHGIVKVGINQTKIFSKKLNSLSSKQKVHLITFLANEEGIKHDQNYQELINALTKIGEKALANKFEAARTERKKEKE
ncbi:MAG: hypothetical protein V4577_18575 [Bacteroidota bacterium]